jgi:hypothetical protein
MFTLARNTSNAAVRLSKKKAVFLWQVKLDIMAAGEFI